MNNSAKTSYKAQISHVYRYTNYLFIAVYQCRWYWDQ